MGGVASTVEGYSPPAIHIIKEYAYQESIGPFMDAMRNWMDLFPPTTVLTLNEFQQVFDIVFSDSEEHYLMWERREGQRQRGDREGQGGMGGLEGSDVMSILAVLLLMCQHPSEGEGEGGVRLLFDLLLHLHCCKGTSALPKECITKSIRSICLCITTLSGRAAPEAYIISNIVDRVYKDSKGTSSSFYFTNFKALMTSVKEVAGFIEQSQDIIKKAAVADVDFTALLGAGALMESDEEGDDDNGVGTYMGSFIWSTNIGHVARQMRIRGDIATVDGGAAGGGVTGGYCLHLMHTKKAKEVLIVTKNEKRTVHLVTQVHMLHLLYEIATELQEEALRSGSSSPPTKVPDEIASYRSCKWTLNGYTAAWVAKLASVFDSRPVVPFILTDQTVPLPLSLAADPPVDGDHGTGAGRGGLLLDQSLYNCFEAIASDATPSALVHTSTTNMEVYGTVTRTKGMKYVHQDILNFFSEEMLDTPLRDLGLCDDKHSSLTVGDETSVLEVLWLIRGTPNVDSAALVTSDNTFNGIVSLSCLTEAAVDISSQGVGSNSNSTDQSQSQGESLLGEGGDGSGGTEKTPETWTNFKPLLLPAKYYRPLPLEQYCCHAGDSLSSAINSFVKNSVTTLYIVDTDFKVVSSLTLQAVFSLMLREGEGAGP